MAANSSSVTPETLITIKITLNDGTKKLKLPLRDLTATVLPAKLRNCLNIPLDHLTVFERYSDSVGGYITLDPSNAPVFKALNRAAKAKGKLRLKATIIPPEEEEEVQQDTTPQVTEPPRLTTATTQTDMTKRQSIGSGIFQYRDARAAMQRAAEAPTPLPFAADIANAHRETSVKAHQELAFRPREPQTCSAVKPCAWTVYCNKCDNALADAHYHCSICDGGDYDLCEPCVSAGHSCPVDDHWLIKRFIKNGKVVTSTTERLSRRSVEVEAKVPGAYQDEAKVLAPPVITRTCNCCVRVQAENEFVTCKDCEDYDLCFHCHANNTHGHHPGHSFEAAVPGTVLPQALHSLLKAGRGVEHNAYCDGCDKRIFGVRHKCLACPDWDYCNDCVKKAASIHPVHRFAAIYEPLREPKTNWTQHPGIYCDGPLCSKKNVQRYITGVRYKCAVCHDTDFCSACEALPHNHHNRTHPLIKFTTPVRNANITTINEDARGNVRSMGDKRPEPVVKTEPVAAAPVQTVADIAPTEEKIVQKLAQPIDGDLSTGRGRVVVPAAMLGADFIKDTIPDGSIMAPGARFTQVWTLRNTGKFPWPAGCSVRYVGGDNMLNVDNGRPSSVASINEAIESSVCGREVAIGEEIAFSITLKAPPREGKSISYWRLKASDGTPFGHRLWCDIDVRGIAKSIEPAAQPAPPPVALPVAFDRTDIDRRLAALDNWSRLPYRERRRPISMMSAIEPWAVPAPIPVSDAHNRARMEALKTRIMQSRSAGRLASPVIKTEPVEPKAAVSVVPVVVKEEPAPQPASEPTPEPVVETSKTEEKTESASSSQMIFPKLEKESPASSLADLQKSKVARVENEEGEVEDFAVPQSPATELEPTSADQLEDFDDIEVLSISAHSEDDGFLTDEEYDILDESDRETVASP